MGYVVPPRSKNEILSIAERIRSALHMTDIEKIPPHIFVECLSVDGKLLNYDICEDSAAENMGEAFYEPVSNTIIIPDNIYLDVCKGQGRARFTVAHEIGHWALGHSVTFARKRDSAFPIYRDSEWQADTFAGYLLAPPRLVSRCCTAEEVMHRFGLSYQAAEISFNNTKKARF